MNKRGLLQQITIVLIMIVVIMFIIGFFSLGSIIIPIIAGEGINSATTIRESIQEGGVSELTNASNVATETTINVLGTLEILVYFVLLGLVMGYLVIAYYVRTYPFLSIFWVLAIVILVIMAMIMSNTYELAKSEPSLNAFYTSWGTNDFLMSYLPVIVLFIGIIGGIILFALVSTNDAETETRML